MNKLARMLIAAVAVSAFLLAWRQPEIERRFAGRLLSEPMLTPGEAFDGMVLTKDAANALPLWVFCSAAEENERSIHVDCGELPATRLAIGQPFGVMELFPERTGWEDLAWELSVDGHPIDLDAFGVYDAGYPGITSGPSPVREVFKWERLWNVVLANPAPGLHRLQGQARSQDGATFTWVVRFTVREDL